MNKIVKMNLPLLLLFCTVACSQTGKKSSLTGGINVENLDKTVAPGTDFYQFACGGWMKAHPLSGEYGHFGSFDLLVENNRKQMKGLIEGLAAEQSETGSIARKIGDLYTMAMDSTRLNAEAGAPLKALLKKIASLKKGKEMIRLVAEMTRQGYRPYFEIYVAPDDMNSIVNLVQTSQGGLGLGDRDYYLEEDDHNRDIRSKYKEHMIKMFQLAGWDLKEAQKAAEGAMAVETRLAKASYEKVKMRDPHANYHKMSLKELQNSVPGIDWEIYFSTIGLQGISELNVGQPEQLQEVGNILEQADLDEQKAYLQWKAINGAAPYLSDDFVKENFEFNGKVLSGLKEMQSRWKRAVAAVDRAMGEAVGQMYVGKYFPAVAKERMVKLVGNLQEAFGKRIRSVEWMSEETKAKALEKLAAVRVKVGYPDSWRDYSGLDIRKDSYWANILRSNEFDFDYMIAKAGKPVDRGEWLMTPQTVNAYYNPTTNEICFPAGILQHPFFDMEADDAFNYGAIGVVIGHEMTHGFDDQGRLYDKDGNLKDWWTEEDAENFKKRTQVLVDWFDQIEVLPGLKANGQLTLGENIADYGGLQVAFQAFCHATQDKPLDDVDGFTPEQRFYLAYANVWAGNIREEQIRLLTQMDEHSLGRWRVNATLQHINGWYKAFGIGEKDPMYLTPDKRASIW